MGQLLEFVFIFHKARHTVCSLFAHIEKRAIFPKKTMPRNLHAQLRYLTIDRCLQRRQQRWTWQDLAAACGDTLRQRRPAAEDPSRRAILGDIQMMRSGELGYAAPIQVVDKKYYTYTDPHFSIHRSPLRASDLADLQEVLLLLRSFSNFQVIQEFNELVTRLENTLDQRNSALTSPTFIQFDQLHQAPGHEWRDVLYPCVRNWQTVWLTYQPFLAPEPFRLPFSPYLLKEFNRRWFVIGYDHTDYRIHTYALDRIVGCTENLATPYYRDPHFEPTYWYRHLYGVSTPYDAEPETIVLTTTPLRAHYLRSKPLHASQQEVGATDERVTFQFFLIINYEWEQLLLSFSDEVRVEAPPALATRLAGRLRAAAESYF
jgi:predicted DNA-binding transcriptional regulator YafY